MDSFRGSVLPKLSTLILAAAVGALVGIGVYQAAIKGYLPFNRTSQSVATQKVETVVSEQDSIVNTIDQVSPSVVAIGSTEKAFNPFNPFAGSNSQSDTIATGFVVSDKGIIITNKHVVSDTTVKYTVITKDGKNLAVQKIYRDPILDLAIIQVSGSNLEPLTLGDSSQLKVGQTVIAIGNALGQLTNTVTTGVVSGLGRHVIAGDPFSGSAESLDDVIQTSAAINPGNSGGPLLNSAGQVIGVNVATSEGAQNIGFAIPINDVKKIVDEFVTTGKVDRPFLGVEYRFVDRNLAIMEQVPQGDYIVSVVDNSAAANAGIAQGDIITKIDNQAIDSEAKLGSIIASHKIGDQVNMTLWRDGQVQDVKVSLIGSSGQ